MLDSIVASFEQGYSAETIQQQYPALSLEDGYGSVAHSDEVLKYSKRQQVVWDQGRAKTAVQPSPVAQRLRIIQAPKASAAS